MKKADLEERLRWILTPPVHELLSDPQLCLPEKPYPYQMIGIKWLYDREFALLADEMGLGKTMQAILAARLLFRAGQIEQILVVCPKTLIPNWRVEFNKWWPQVSHNIMVAGSDRRWFLRLGTRNATVKIINYASLRQELEWVKSQPFSHDIVIIDEAQRIKTPSTRTARAVKALKADRRWALTGTPLENRVEDLVSIFDFLKPGLLSIFDFLKPGLLDSDQPDRIKGVIPPHMLHMLRRRTEEVLPDLPEKSDQDIALELVGAQREAYVRAETEGVIELNSKGDSITVTHVLALITKLRQICNFDLGSGMSAKLDMLCEDLQEIAASGRKALVFSQFVSQDYGIRRISGVLAKKGYRPLELHGQVPSNRRAGIVRQFSEDPHSRALLLNFAVGGVGLNLQAANYVYLFDRWWNPAVEDNAVKRAHRIGQNHKVFIRRFYCKDTIEERILRKLQEKRALFRHFIDESRPAESMGLTQEEFFSLFNLKVGPRRKPQKSGPIPVILDNMDPREFENLVAELYEKQGYSVAVTPASHDAGIDVLAEKQEGGARERVVIQCKHVKTSVGRPVLQQLWGVVSDDPSFTRGDLVTSGSFTAQAREFARGKRLTLIDRSALSALVEKHGVARLEKGLPADGNGIGEFRRHP